MDIDNYLKSTENSNIFEQLIEKMTGEKPSPQIDKIDLPNIFIKFPDGIGFSQFNEILLCMGHHRIRKEFFQFLCDQTYEYKLGTKLKSIEEFEKGVHYFMKIALFAYGNIQFAYRKLSSEIGFLEFWLNEGLAPISEDIFLQRHDPIKGIKEIKGEDTYYLGYIIENQIKKMLTVDPDNENAKLQDLKRKETIQYGIENYEAYLASDHLDVYIATSMRERHEYYFVNKWVNEIFNNPRLKNLKLRWFDPTQAYCNNRIDKGIFEGLMLKRASCTVYFVQELDTIGKDSELAVTLAQGKPVIAFIPEVNEQYVEDLILKLKEFEKEKNENKIILDQLSIFNPKGAWDDKEINKWCQNPNNMDTCKAKTKLLETMKNHYSKRAELLKETHPLGIQVNLTNGVANGVLVVRSLSDCAELIYRIITITMNFSLHEQVDNNLKYVYLKENISDCIFRVVTGDSMLTNSFWNYYLIK